MQLLVTVRKIQDTDNWNRKHWIALCGKLALEEAVDLPKDRLQNDTWWQSKSGLVRFSVEICRSHTVRHTQLVGLLWTSDRLVAEAVNYATHTHTHTHTKQQKNIHDISGIRPAVSAIERLQTYALDCTTTGIGRISIKLCFLLFILIAVLSYTLWN
jgi:hypothetical protein